jgi:hypothetical protein
MADNNDNIKNEESRLFKQLTRLFSGPIVNHRQQNVRKRRRKALDNYATRFTSASGKQFQKADRNPFAMINSEAMANQLRNERYVDFDQMEYEPIIASAMDIYADEMTFHNELNPMLGIDCPNEEIKTTLTTLYKSVLNVEFNLYGWCRTMCKYGDYFLYLDIDEKAGVKSFVPMPTAEVERMEGEDETNPNYVQYQWNSAGLTFENWQVAHFRILGNDKYAPYGTSILEPARRIWRQLHLLEDAMMSYRITRAPERRVFYIDVGNIAPQDVEQYMGKVMTQMKRNQVVDSSTGRVDLRYNPLSTDEDFFIPTRAGESSKVESLPGGTYTGDIDDVKYLRDKLFAALKIPQSYLSRGEGSDEDKTTLAQKDIRFARTIQRLQRSIIAELEKVGIVHLYTLGYRNDDLINFKLSLNNPSQIAAMQELEHLRTKFDIAGAATEGYFSKQWVYKNIFGLADEQIIRIQREMFYDKKYEAALEAAAEEDAAGDEGGGDEGGLGDLGGGDDGGGDLGGLGDEGEDEEGGDDEDGTLLAAPGKRDSYLTPGAKGHEYTPKVTDTRDMGARKRSIKSKWSQETASSTRRNTFKGLSDFLSLSKGISEGEDTTYGENHEKLLLEVNRELSSGEVQNLINELENREDDRKNKTTKD